MKIYVNPNTFECHTTNPDGTYLEYKTPFFDGKCETFIEAHLCVPPGYSCTRSDGETFTGEMITPFKDSREFEGVQREYDIQMLAMYEESLKVVGVKV